MADNNETLRRAIRHAPRGGWPVAKTVATLTLAFADRHKRRIRLQSDDGQDLMLDLPRAVLMTEGDGLELAGGGFVAVHAAAEALLEVSASSPAHLARLAWHVGNRHTEVQILDDLHLRVRKDHVLEDMLIGLGAETDPVTAPFIPEQGAYAGGGHSHGHSHSHAHSHSHSHSHSHGAAE